VSGLAAYLMNKIRILLLATLLAGCRKDSEPAVSRLHWGEIAGEVNGEPFTRFMSVGGPYSYEIYGVSGYDISSHPCNDSTFSVMVSRLNGQGYSRDQLALAKIPRRPGTYRLAGTPANCATDPSASASFSTHLADGDVVNSHYRTLLSEDHWVTVQVYDAASGQVNGTFAVTQVLDERVAPMVPAYPDTIRLRNMVFHTKLLLDPRR
jgi:hypothetical protein